MDASNWMHAEHACKELVVRAAIYADANDHAALALLFAEDATLTRPNAEPLQGREAIRRAYEQRPAGRITRHLVTNTLVEPESETSARALSYVLLWTAKSADAAGPWGRPADARQLVGEFEDRFSRTPEGRWLIQQREARFVLHNGS